MARVDNQVSYLVCLPGGEGDTVFGGPDMLRLFGIDPDQEDEWAKYISVLM